MYLRVHQLLCAATAALALSASTVAGANPPQSGDKPAPAFAGVQSLSLPPAQAAALSRALAQRNYISAEKILLPQIHLQDKSKSTARLLSFMGAIYYLDHDYLHAAVAWKKSEAIEPLEASVQFSLAMSYIELGRRDWARGVLERLCAGDPKNALYPFWLGRLDYDTHAYSEGVVHFQQAIALDATMARAYDNLGLCYFHENQNDLAIRSFRQAIDLESHDVHPSAWPYFNLGVTEQFLNRNTEAETDLRRATQLDSQFAQAYYELGNVLERQQRLAEAKVAWLQAAQADADYAEPHLALARFYRKQGDHSSADEQLQIYFRLHHASSTSSSSR